MLKKLTAVLLAVVFTIGLCAAPVYAAEENVNAIGITQTLVVDGEEFEFQAYNIGGYNYFMLRDMAKLLNFDLYLEDGVIIIDTAHDYGYHDNQTAQEPEPEPETVSIRGREYSTKLTSLEFNKEDLSESDLEQLKYMKELTELSIIESKISNLDFLANMTKIKELDFFKNNITDISVVTKLTGIESLSITYNSITDISALKGLTSLKNLGLMSNRITNIEALESLTNLEILNLNNNELKDINALKNLSNLKQLYLSYTQIRDMEVFGSLTSLENLNLYGNQLTDADIEALVEIIKDLPNLQILSLGGNSRITDINALKKLTRLRNLNLNGNENIDEADIEELRTALPECFIFAEN